MGTTIESDWENTRLLDELEAARAEIERLKTVPMKYRRMAFNAHLQDENAKLSKQLAAEQAKNVEMRKEFQSFIDSHEECEDFDGFTAQIVSMDDYHSATGSLEATPSDTSVLEAIVKKAGEVMRERSINVAWNNEPDCNGPIEMEIRTLPAVTLEDLK